MRPMPRMSLVVPRRDRALWYAMLAHATGIIVRPWSSKRQATIDARAVATLTAMGLPV